MTRKLISIFLVCIAAILQSCSGGTLNDQQIVDRLVGEWREPDLLDGEYTFLSPVFYEYVFLNDGSVTKKYFDDDIEYQRYGIFSVNDSVIMISLGQWETCIEDGDPTSCPSSSNATEQLESPQFGTLDQEDLNGYTFFEYESNGFTRALIRIDN